MGDEQTFKTVVQLGLPLGTLQMPPNLQFSLFRGLENKVRDPGDFMDAAIEYIEYARDANDLFQLAQMSHTNGNGNPNPTPASDPDPNPNPNPNPDPNPNPNQVLLPRWTTSIAPSSPCAARGRRWIGWCRCFPCDLLSYVYMDNGMVRCAAC